MVSHLSYLCRDTAGQERFRTITTAYYRGAMGIMLVYDITQEKSFENIKNWIRNIEENAAADVEKMLLGNKCELNEKRQVCANTEMGEGGRHGKAPKLTRYLSLPLPFRLPESVVNS